MANPNPWKARLARYQRQPPGDIDALRRHTWAALMVAFEGCATTDADQRRKALLAYSQLASVYLRLFEVGELDARLQALEMAMPHNGHHEFP
jgi:hypothetical protein